VLIGFIFSQFIQNVFVLSVQFTPNICAGVTASVSCSVDSSLTLGSGSKMPEVTLLKLLKEYLLPSDKCNRR
jgi:hypothetical protein